MVSDTEPSPVRSEAAPPGAAAEAELSSGRLAWITFVMASVAFLAAVDRNVLNILLDPIKTSLGATDTEMGFLTGLAFTLVLVTVGIPVARLADRTNRRNLLAIAVAFWSVMTAVSGLAGSYIQLLLARFGVAAGESAHQPTSLSMVGDFFPAAKRGARIGFIVVGSTAGYAVGSIAAGVLNDMYDWHVAMLGVGAPGLLVAALIYLTISEPKRGAQDGGIDRTPVSMSGALRRMGRIRSWPALLAGLVFLNVGFTGFLAWNTTLFTRVHHMSTAQASVVSAVFFGLGPVIANASAGFLSDRLARRGARWRMYLASAMAALSAPFLAIGILSPDTAYAIAFMGLYTILSGGLTTVYQAASLSITPPNIRATVFSINYFVVGIMGGLGAVIVGRLNDTVFKAEGKEALHHSMLVLPAGMALCALMFLIASRQMDHDVAQLSAGSEPAAGG